MPWARLDEKVLNHPKILRLKDPDFRLWIAGLLHAQQYLTNGYIEPSALVNLSAFTPARQTVLITVGLWETSGNGVQIHDYLDWNDSRETVLRDRELSKLRMRRMRERRRNGQSGYAVSYGEVTPAVTPSVTVPTHVRTYVRTSTDPVLVQTTTVLAEGELLRNSHAPANDKKKKGHHHHAFCGDHFCVTDNQHEMFARHLGSARDRVDLLALYPKLDALDEPIDNLLPWLREKIAAEVGPTAPKVSKLTAALDKIGDNW